MSARRISVNILATYAQTAASVVFGLWTTRWIYKALGADQQGLFSVVGTLFVLVGIISSTLRSACARFFAYAIGEEKVGHAENDLLCRWFNVAVSTYFALALVFFVILLPVGYFGVFHFLKIPDGRHSACWIVFLLSLFSMLYGQVLTPVQSLYVAKQYIFIKNMMHIAESLLMFGESWWLLHYSGDRFITHAIILTGINMSVSATYYLIGHFQFPEMRVRFKYWWDKEKMRKLFSFSGWYFFETMSFSVFSSVRKILFNQLDGPAINSSAGNSARITSKISMFADATNTTVAPEINTRMGAGDVSGAVAVAKRVCTYTTMLEMMIAIPVLVYAQPILTLWLDVPPPYMSTFITATIVCQLSEKVSTGYFLLLVARGRIKRYSIVFGTGNLVRLLLFSTLYYFSRSIPLAIFAGSVLPWIFMTNWRVFLVQKNLKISAAEFFSRILAPMTAVFSACFLTVFAYRTAFGAYWPVLLAAFPINAALVASLTWLVVGKSERKYLVATVKKVIHKKTH